MRERRFFKNVINVEVITEDRAFEPRNVSDVNIDIGYSLGRSNLTQYNEITTKEVAKFAIEIGYSLAFLGLDKDGNWVEQEYNYCDHCSAVIPDEYACNNYFNKYHLETCEYFAPNFPTIEK